MKTVVVGMSGGVDSSVTAYLLKQQGYRVVGLFMKNWEDEDDTCPAYQDYQDVVAICSQLDIPHYSVNFSKSYWDEVFVVCLQAFRAGHTPNPDILCNREIKFKLFFQKALELGATYMATGHYCRRYPLPHGEWALARGIDPDKDQSYFLYTLKSKIIEKVLFPVGEMTKKHVREIAHQAGLVTAAKKDSTGICFIGKRDFRSFLSRYIAPKPGDFRTPEGQWVGRHEGIAYYTIGQRKGLAIGGAGEAWYVVSKEPEENVVVVVQGDNHPALYRRELVAREVSWVGSHPLFPLRCTAKIRYRTEDVACLLRAHERGGVHVEFDTPQKAVTLGQAIVFYQGEICLGGGVITTNL